MRWKRMRPTRAPEPTGAAATPAISINLTRRSVLSQRPSPSSGDVRRSHIVRAGTLMTPSGDPRHVTAFLIVERRHLAI